MSKRTLLAAVGIVLLLATPVWAQSATPAGSFDSLSPGNQKITNALFSAQNTAGTTRTPLTRDQIAGLKGTQGWGGVFKQMRADGLVQARNLGQVVSGHQHQLHASRTGSGGATARAASTATATNAARGGRTTALASTRSNGHGAGLANRRSFDAGSHAMGGRFHSSPAGGFGRPSMGGGFGAGGHGSFGGHGGGGGRGK